MKNKLEFIGFISFIKLFKILPYRLAEWLFAHIFILGGYYLGIRKQIARKNLQMIFPDMKTNHQNKIIKKMYYHLGITAAETYLGKLSDLASRTAFEEKENIEKALQANKGVIISTGHFGNWELAGRTMAQNWPVSVVIKKQRNPYFNSYTNKLREAENIQIIYRKRALRGILKFLRKNALVCLLIDQNARARGMKMNFLAEPASVFTGAAKISIKTGAPVVRAVAIRKENGEHIFRFEEPLFPDNYKNNDHDIKKYTRKINSSLEKYIRLYPEQWFWVHRRWRKPDKARR
jgi:KDO2-lipid IV(A) lauroyltransferase